MSLSAKARRAPVRVVTGAFILNSGLGKLKADEQTARALHGMASGTYGFLGKVEPKLFAKGLATGEIALGAAVLAPFVSPVVAGLGLVGFSGALLNMYWNTPGMHQPNDPRPTQQGLPIAKDVWMLGIGAGLVADGLLEPAHDKKIEITATKHGKKVGRQRRKDRKAARKARAEARQDALDATKGAGIELGRRAQKAADKAATVASKRAKQAAKDAKKASKKAGKRTSSAVDQVKGSDVADTARGLAGSARESLGEALDTYGPVIADRVTTTAKQARSAARGAVDEYAPVVAEKAKQAGAAARDYAEEHGPAVADRVVGTAKQARDLARDYADEYGPVAVERAKAARDAAQAAAEKARERVAG